MRVSKFSDMIPAVVTLAVFTGALVLFPGKGLFVYPVPAYIVFALCECMALLNVWALGKYYVLTDQGIEHKFLGIRYRTTQWDEIGDVMRSRHPQRTQGKEQVLVITRKGAKVLREDAFAVCARLDQGRPVCHPPDRCAQCRQDPAVCAGALWQAGL